jgi:hypothetical protein
MSEPTTEAIEKLARELDDALDIGGYAMGDGPSSRDYARAVLAAGYVKREDTDEGWTTLVDEHGKVLAFLDDLKRESERGRGADIAGMVDAYLERPDTQVERADKYHITIGGSRPLAANADQERRIREMSADQRYKLAQMLGKTR